MKRICFLADAKSSHTKRWVNYFVDRGYDCHLISFEKGEGIKLRSHLLGYKISHGGLRFFFAKNKAKKIIEKIKPDIINAHFVISYGLLGAKIKKKPLVVSCWGSDILLSPHRSFLHKLRVDYVLNRACLFTSDGFNLTRALVNLGVEEKRIVTSPMGVDKNLFNLMKKKEKGSVTILSLRRLEPLYDIKTLIHSIPSVLEQTKKPIRFVIVGEGSEKDQLERLTHALNVKDYVEFKGRVTQHELLELLSCSDIYVSTSLSDSTSVSLLEGMAAGLIPVVTDIPGNREWIKHGNNGFLFRPKDHRDLAQKLVPLINNFEKYNSFKGQNRSIIEKRALWEANMKVIENKFIELCH